MAASISPLSTPPVSIGITPSVVSEIERSQGKPEELRMPDPVVPLGPGEPNVVSDVPTIIDLGDGDIELKVNNTTFKSHRHLLNDFARLKEMIKGMERYDSGAQCITVYRDERGVEDFKNMFKVLHASLIKGPFEFDAPTLVSCLRLATAYEYPELRKFSVDRLEEGATLSPIERIELAREFDLSAWDEGAFQELAGRDEPITRDEAKVLGVERFEELARARENEKVKKGIEEEKARREAEEKKKAEEEEQRKREEEEAQRQREEEEKRQEEERKRQEEAQKAEEEKKKQEAQS